jgi:hypothetical protein
VRAVRVHGGIEGLARQRRLRVGLAVERVGARDAWDGKKLP